MCTSKNEAFKVIYILVDILTAGTLMWILLRAKRLQNISLVERVFFIYFFIILFYLNKFKSSNVIIEKKFFHAEKKSHFVV